MACTRVLISLIVIVIVLSGCERATTRRRSSLASTQAPAPPGMALSPPKCAVSDFIRGEPPQDPNADPFGFGERYVNRDRTIWVRREPWRAGPDGNKVIWIRPAGTQLVITGRRLDVPAPPLRVQAPCCYPTGFQVTGLISPTAGCWEISAKAGASELHFVTEVAAR